MSGSLFTLGRNQLEARKVVTYQAHKTDENIKAG
jgi:hypothetical protein